MQTDKLGFILLAMKKIAIYVFGFLMLVSCTNKQTTMNNYEENLQDTGIDSVKLQIKDSHLIAKIGEPFQVENIQKLEFTSEVNESSVDNDYCDTIEKGTFGSYFLIDSDFSDEIGRPVGGIITVHYNNGKKGWRADDKTQTIWKIHLKSDVISVWDSIKIGMTLSQIENFGRENNGLCIEKGDDSYSCDFNNFLVAYTFKRDTLKELIITRKCEKEAEI